MAWLDGLQLLAHLRDHQAVGPSGSSRADTPVGGLQLARRHPPDPAGQADDAVTAP